MTRSTRRRLLASTGLLLAAGVVGGNDRTVDRTATDASRKERDVPGQANVARQDVQSVETVASDLEIPWGIDAASDGTLYFTERPGRVSRLTADGVEPLAELEGTNHAGEGGLLGLALHPEFPDTPSLYLYQTYEDDGPKNRILRHRLSDGELEREAVLLDGIPGAEKHDGGRLAFGPDGYLYATVGDAAEAEEAQNPDSLNGTVLRLGADGSVPPGCDGPVFSYGHRNPQGLAFHPESGELYSTEHGTNRHDEVNLLELANNYGWPEVQGPSDDPRFTDPLVSYSPSIAPASAAFFDGAFYFGALAAEHLHRVTFGDDGRTVESDETLFEGEFGRIRSVVAANDGLYFVTSNRDGRGSPASDDDRILRFTP